jgi:hypothetical protein
MQMMKKISMGCDHAGYGLKLELSKKLEASGYEISDRGTYSEESVDYPDYAHRVAEEVDFDLWFGQWCSYGSEQTPGYQSSYLLDTRNSCIVTAAQQCEHTLFAGQICQSGRGIPNYRKISEYFV